MSQFYTVKFILNPFIANRNVINFLCINMCNKDMVNCDSLLYVYGVPSTLLHYIMDCPCLLTAYHDANNHRVIYDNT